MIGKSLGVFYANSDPFWFLKNELSYFKGAHRVFDPNPHYIMILIRSKNSPNHIDS